LVYGQGNVIVGTAGINNRGSSKAQETFLEMVDRSLELCNGPQVFCVADLQVLVSALVRRAIHFLKEPKKKHQFFVSVLNELGWFLMSNGVCKPAAKNATSLGQQFKNASLEFRQICRAATSVDSQDRAALNFLRILVDLKVSNFRSALGIGTAHLSTGTSKEDSDVGEPSDDTRALQQLVDDARNELINSDFLIQALREELIDEKQKRLASTLKYPIPLLVFCLSVPLSTLE